jgi:hypothetical protein
MQDKLHTIVSILMPRLMGCFAAFIKCQVCELLMIVRLAEKNKLKMIRIPSAGVALGCNVQMLKCLQDVA